MYYSNVQTKNSITRRSVEKELYKGINDTIKINLLLCGIYVLLLPCVILAVYVAVEKSVMAVAVVIAVILSFPLLFFIYCICDALRAKSLIKKGKFKISVCELQYKEEKTERNGKHFRIYKNLYFEGFDEVIVDNTAFQLATLKDMYYVVHYENKRVAQLIYPEKMYKYVED